MRSLIIIMLLTFSSEALSESGIVLNDTLSESQVIAVCESYPEITVDVIGLFSGDLLFTYNSEKFLMGNWQPEITAGIYNSTIAIGAGIGLDENRNLWDCWELECTGGIKYNISMLITFQDKFQGWFGPGIGYKIVVHKNWLGRYAVIEPELQANLGTSFFISVNLNIGVGI